jgi:type II secretion system protein C
VRDDSEDSSKGIPERLKRWLSGARERSGSLLSRLGRSRIGSTLSNRFEGSSTRFEFDLKKVELKSVAAKSGWIRWGLLTLSLFLAAAITDRVIGLFVRPTYAPIPRRATGPSAQNFRPMGAEYDSILRRNMFNVEGKIPQPFDQGQLDCMSQAKLSTQKIQLLGTIVMNDEQLSVALLQDDNNPVKMAVRKDEAFSDNKYVAKKVERKKFCFQVKSSGDFEFIEIPDDSGNLGVEGPSLLSSSDGIVPVNDRNYMVKKSFLDSNLTNLQGILQTARAVPYIEPGSGKFMGFLVQSVDPGSPFSQLGIHQGDILTNVNDITLDNAGKGLEAFQRLRNSPDVVLGIIRGGEKTTINFSIK